MSARSTRTALAAVLLAAGAVVAGCGGSDDGATSAATTTAPPRITSTGPVASTPDATQPPPQATEPLPPEQGTPTTTTPPPTETAPPGDAAEEEPVRVPATFTAEGDALTPPRITVPPFLAVEVSVASGDGRAHVVVVGTPRSRRFEVPAGARGAVMVPGLRAGEYPIELDGREAGTLVVGGEVGP